MARETITMTQKELSRYEIIQNLIKKKINGTTASKQIGLSIRQTKRIKAKVVKQGPKGIIHANRDKPGNHRIPEQKIKQAEQIIRKRYFDFGPTFATEKLETNHQIKISKEALRHLMIQWKLWQPKPRKQNKEYRSWRPRKEQYGEMIQFDGSYHQWFENRAPECCLLAAIDDASGKLTKLKFGQNESVLAVFKFWKEYVQSQGKPISIYLDKYSTYKINHKSALDNENLLTKFQRVVRDLDIRLITANSAQGKGRVERLFGTLQDRLVKELRLRGISDIDRANEFLEQEFIPMFNQKFSVLAQKKGNLHRKLTKIDKENLDRIFSIQENRVVNNDFTIRYKIKWFQLDEKQPCLVLRKDKVLVEQRLNGQIFISLRNEYLNYTELADRPEKVKMKITALSGSKQEWKPPADHPWRKAFLVEKARKQAVSVN